MSWALGLFFVFALFALSGLAPAANPPWLDASTTTAAPSTFAYDDGDYRYDPVVIPVDRGVEDPAARDSQDGAGRESDSDEP